MASALGNKLVVVTGGSSGIGAAAARIMSERGAHVVISGRSQDTTRLAEEVGCDACLVDYARFSDVRAFAQELREKYARIDVLVNNVGGIFASRRTTHDGHEMTLQVNHLSGFLLTKLLRDRLEASRAVVINTSSVANLSGHIDFDDLESEKRYSSFRAYGTTKLMNILHVMEIGRRFHGVNAVAFHPGSVATGFAREGSAVMKWLFESPLKHLFLVPPERAAETLISLVAGEPNEDWKPGEYYVKGKPGRKNRQADPASAQKLWDASERLIALTEPSA